MKSSSRPCANKAGMKQDGADLIGSSFSMLKLAFLSIVFFIILKATFMTVFGIFCCRSEREWTGYANLEMTNKFICQNLQRRKWAVKHQASDGRIRNTKHERCCGAHTSTP